MIINQEQTENWLDRTLQSQAGWIHHWLYQPTDLYDPGPAKGSAFNEKSIVPIANHLKETSVVVVRADSKWKTLKDLVADAQQNPGKLKASTNGVQASNHTAAQLLAKSAKFEYNAVPYGGTADQLLALRQGEVDFSCAKVGDVEPLIGGASPVLRVLGVYSENGWTI